MANEKTRILELFYLLSKSNDFINSATLAHKVNVSERTVKSDIKELEDFALASGSHIESRKSKGYRLIVDDANVYNPVKDQLRFHFEMYGNAFVGKNTRVNDIIRRIICEEDYLTLDDIADELYLTKSALRDDSKEVRQFLECFNLRIKNIYEDGPLVVGSEYNRRAAMLCVFENHYHEALTLYKNNEYLQWFDFDQQQRYDIRHLFLKILRESECGIRDDHTQRLSRYLCLMVNRYNAGYPLIYSEEQRLFIKQFKQYEVSKKLFDELENLYMFKLDDNELCGFAFQLLAFADIHRSVNAEKFYAPIYSLANECAMEFVEVIKLRYGIDFTQIDNAIPLFIRGIIPLLIQERFDTTLHLIRNVTSEDERILVTPFATYLSFELNNLFKRKYNCKISLYNLVTFASFIQECITNINYPFVPIRVAITTSDGINNSELIGSIIGRRFPGCFECLDTYQLYELRGVKRDAYDYLIVSFPLFSYKYEWPYIAVDSIPTQQQLNQIFNEAILSGVKLEPIVDKFNFKEINIFKNFQLSSLDYFIDLLSFKHGKDNASVRGIKQELYEIMSAFIHNKMMLLWINREYVENDFVEIYRLNNEQQHYDCTFNTIVVLSLQMNHDIACTRFISDFIYVLLNKSKYIERIIEQHNKTVMIDCVKEALKALPIALN